MNKLSSFIASSLVATTIVLSSVPRACAAPNAVTKAAPSHSTSLEELTREVDRNPKGSPEIIDQLNALLAKEPKNAQAHFVLARVLENNGYDSLAEAEYLKSDELAPMQASTLLDLFTKRFQQNNLDSAKKYYTYLETRFPKDPTVVYMRGALLESKFPGISDSLFNDAVSTSAPGSGIRTGVAAFRLSWGRPEEALSLVLQDLRVHPNNYQSVVIAGKSYYALGRSEQAVDYLKRAFEDRPTDTNVAEIYTKALLNLGRNSEALTPALVCLSMQTEHTKMERAKETVGLLIKNLSAEQLNSELAKVDEILKNTLYRYRLHLAVGDILDRAGHRKLAIEEFKKGVTENPQAARGYYRLAVDMQTQGNYEEALDYLKRALRADREDPQIRTGFVRMKIRLANRSNDIAWRAKDWLRQASTGQQ